MKIPKARKLPSGNWFIQMRLGGESVPVTALTEKECIRMATLIKAEYKADRRVERVSGVTLRQAIEKYIDKRRNVLSPSTIRGYSQIKKNRFGGVMDRPLKDIKGWQAICNQEAAGCAAKTLKNAWLFVVSVLREQDMDVPKVKLPQIVGKEREFLEPEQIPIFIAAVKGKSFEIPALLALHGLRSSEIWAMPEIDLRSGIIKVRGALVPDENNEMVKKLTNKNTSSRRDVPVMIPALEEALAYGYEIKHRQTVVHKQIDSLCRKNGLPEVGIHGLRHSFASLGYHLGVSEAYIMQIGGWAEYSTVRKIYTHLAQRDALKSQNSMAEFFKNANRKMEDAEIVDG